MLNKVKLWLKTSDSPIAKIGFKAAWYLLHFELPVYKPFARIILAIHSAVTSLWRSICRVCYWTPLFKAQIETKAKQLYLYGGMPYVTGMLRIKVGDRCRISGVTTFTGRMALSKQFSTPLLDVGDNVDIGWQTTIAVGSMVKIGHNVRIAGRCFLAGYPGHPLDAVARAKGESELDSQVGDIILEDDVWLASGVSVMPGVTIGSGTVVATGSVVTKDLPARVMAGGIPAKVIKPIEQIVENSSEGA